MGTYYHFQPEKVVLSFKDLKKKYVHIVGLCVCLHADAYRVQKRPLDPLELELQAAVGYPTRMLNTELGSSAKATCTLNHRALSLPRPAPFPFIGQSLHSLVWPQTHDPLRVGSELQWAVPWSWGLESVQGQAASSLRDGWVLQECGC